MAELHSNLYFRHDQPDIHQRLYQLFATADMNAAEQVADADLRRRRLIDLAEALNPEAGQALMIDLLSCWELQSGESFGSESISETDGFWVVHWVNGSSGDALTGQLVEFLHALCPEVQVQAWGCGDDDPWEFWFKIEGGSLVRNDDEPLCDEDEDQEIRATIYDWWHEGMPDSIAEGFLNEIYLDDQYMVFTGKMTLGTREDMEDLAEGYGAIVQKTVNGKTQILVVGDKPGASKLTKAEGLGVRIISEADFYRIVDEE